MLPRATPAWKNPQFILTMLAVAAVITSAYVHIQDMDARILRIETMLSDHDKHDAEHERELDRKFQTFSETDRGSLVDRRDMQSRLLRLETIVERNSSRIDRLEGLQWKSPPDRFGPPKGAAIGG